MVINIYSLLDTKTGLFSVPWFLPHDHTAIRSVVELAQDRNTNVGKYPSDFTLMALGLYDDNTGQLQSYTAPRNMGTVSALVAQIYANANSQLQEGTSQ